MLFRVQLIVLIASPLMAAVAWGQTGFPMLMSLSPVAVQTGQSTEHTLKSRHSMSGAFEVFITGKGVTGEVVMPAKKPGEKKDLQEVKIRFTAVTNAEPGIR